MLPVSPEQISLAFAASGNATVRVARSSLASATIGNPPAVAAEVVPPASRTAAASKAWIERRIDGSHKGLEIVAELERVKGIEPSYSAWKAAALPLSYPRVGDHLTRPGGGLNCPARPLISSPVP